jgi:hypothetical protein
MSIEKLTQTELGTQYTSVTKYLHVGCIFFLCSKQEPNINYTKLAMRAI